MQIGRLNMHYAMISIYTRIPTTHVIMATGIYTCVYYVHVHHTLFDLCNVVHIWDKYTLDSIGSDYRMYAAIRSVFCTVVQVKTDPCVIRVLDACTIGNLLRLKTTKLYIYS